LCSVARWFWRAILAYAAERDCSKGESDEYIFDGGAACLKVYVPKQRAGLQPGYHFVAYGHSSGGDALHESNVTIAWQPFPQLGGERPAYSRDRAWDAEYAHEWLMTSLFPTVLAWMRSKEWQQTGPINKLRRRFNTSQSRDLRVENVGFSLAKVPFRWTALKFIDRDDALSAVRSLQSHFTVYQSIAPVEGEIRRRILDLVLYLLPRYEAGHHDYIRGNLGIREPSTAAGLQSLIEQTTASAFSGGSLDMPLRSLIAALQDVVELTPTRLDHVARELGTVWKRWQEDLLCSIYS
jgi:hypothetical protein